MIRRQDGVYWYLCSPVTQLENMGSGVPEFGGHLYAGDINPFSDMRVQFGKPEESGSGRQVVRFPFQCIRAQDRITVLDIGIHVPV